MCGPGQACFVLLTQDGASSLLHMSRQRWSSCWLNSWVSGEEKHELAGSGLLHMFGTGQARMARLSTHVSMYVVSILRQLTQLACFVARM